INGRPSQMQTENYRTQQLGVNDRNAFGIAYIPGPGGTFNEAQKNTIQGLIGPVSTLIGTDPGRVFGHVELQGNDPERGRGGGLGPNGSAEGELLASQIRDAAPTAPAAPGLSPDQIAQLSWSQGLSNLPTGFPQTTPGLGVLGIINQMMPNAVNAPGPLI